MMRKALGRGLDALIPSITPAKTGPSSDTAGRGEPLKVAISRIRPNHLQPRRYFDPEKLAELSASIKEHGLAQPIVVSYDAGSDTYELIAGERRLRATELAGFSEVDVVIKTPRDDQQRLALALIENLQRADLNPIEEALGYLRLMKEFHISQTDLGRFVGKAKSTISNTLRLLDLPAEMQKALETGTLSEAHGRALLMVQDGLERQRLFLRAVELGMSVREVENLARQIEGGLSLVESSNAATPEKRFFERPADIVSLESELQRTLGTKVDIKTKKDPTKGGSITIHFFTLDEFDKVLKVLKK